MNIRDIENPTDTQKYVHSLMSQYTTENLVEGISPENFEETLQRMIGKVEHRSLGVEPHPVHRDPSVKFTWGHTHDFGSFKLDGSMGERHNHML